MAIPIFIYLLITIMLSAQVMFTNSFTVGALALAGTALCYFGTATFFGSFRARHRCLVGPPRARQTPTAPDLSCRAHCRADRLAKRILEDLTNI